MNPFSTSDMRDLCGAGVIDSTEMIRSIIEAVPVSELSALRPKVNAILTERFIAVKRTVKRTRVAELEAWHLRRGDREIIAQNQRSRTWRVYEVKRTKAGALKKGQMIEACYVINGIEDIVWDLATGKY